MVTETWPPEINGVANTINRLVCGLCDTGNFRILLVRPRQNSKEVPVHTHTLQEHLLRGASLPFYSQVRFGFPAYFTLKQLWTEQPVDIVQVVTEGPLCYTAIMAAKKLKIPVFSDFHTNFDQYVRYYRLGFFFTLANRYLRHFHNQTRVTLVPTRELQKNLGYNGYQQTGLLRRGIDTHQFNPQRRSQTLRAKLGIKSGQLLVLLVSRLAQEKNLDLAFETFREIQHYVPDAKFVIVGDGPERNRLQTMHPDCLFQGMRTGVELAKFYASGDLFLYSSKSETFGNVILEAMASGLPVLTFNYAAAKTHIQNGKNGVVVDLSNDTAFKQAGVRLANAPAERLEISSAASNTTSQLGWDSVVISLQQTILKILSEVHDETTSPAQ